MGAETTSLLNALKKITSPLFNPGGTQRTKVLERCFPHPEQEGITHFFKEEEPPADTSPSRKHTDSELETVNSCIRQIHHAPFNSSQKARILNYGEQPMAALYHLKAQALYARLYAASIGNLVFCSNPSTPEFSEFPHCWLQWMHNEQKYLLDPVNYDCAIAI